MNTYLLQFGIGVLLLLFGRWLWVWWAFFRELRLPCIPADSQLAILGAALAFGLLGALCAILL